MVTGTAGRGATCVSGCDRSCAATEPSLRATESTASAVGDGTASAVGNGTAKASDDGKASAIGNGTVEAFGDGTTEADGGGTRAAGRAVHSEQRQTAFSLPVSRHRLALYHAANIQLIM